MAHHLNLGFKNCHDQDQYSTARKKSMRIAMCFCLYRASNSEAAECILCLEIVSPFSFQYPDQTHSSQLHSSCPFWRTALGIANSSLGHCAATQMLFCSVVPASTMGGGRTQLFQHHGEKAYELSCLHFSDWLFVEQTCILSQGFPADSAAMSSNSTT